MHETGIEGYYALKDGKRLRFGYTTGTCAAAAAKAAVRMLVSGVPVETVDILTPKGIPLNLEVLDIRQEGAAVSCAVRKYSGDDPDVTDGVLVYAAVCWRREPGIRIDGGEGVGRVTKPGLKQRIGEAAINPVPRQMILREAERVLDDCGRAAGLQIVISVPGGAALAEHTFNPRLGIAGGISVLGTSGIVEPMSEAALVDSIALELRQKYALGTRRLLVTPGNYGADFLHARCRVADTELVKCANYIGKTIDLAAEAGFPELLLVGNIGKLIKLTGGIMDTHSRQADARAELMAACALRAGAPAKTARALLDCLTTDEMLRVLEQTGLLRRTMDEVGTRMEFYLNCRGAGRITVGAAAFSTAQGILCMTGPAEQWLRELEERT